MFLNGHLQFEQFVSETMKSLGGYYLGFCHVFFIHRCREHTVSPAYWGTRRTQRDQLSGQANSELHLYLEVGNSKFLVGRFNWNAKPQIVPYSDAEIS